MNIFAALKRFVAYDFQAFTKFGEGANDIFAALVEQEYLPVIQKAIDAEEVGTPKRKKLEDLYEAWNDGVKRTTLQLKIHQKVRKLFLQIGDIGTEIVSDVLTDEVLANMDEFPRKIDPFTKTPNQLEDWIAVIVQRRSIDILNKQYKLRSQDPIKMVPFEVDEDEFSWIDTIGDKQITDPDDGDKVLKQYVENMYRFLDDDEALMLRYWLDITLGNEHMPMRKVIKDVAEKLNVKNYRSLYPKWNAIKKKLVKFFEEHMDRPMSPGEKRRFNIAGLTDTLTYERVAYSLSRYILAGVKVDLASDEYMTPNDAVDEIREERKLRDADNISDRVARDVIGKGI